MKYTVSIAGIAPKQIQSTDFLYVLRIHLQEQVRQTQFTPPLTAANRHHRHKFGITHNYPPPSFNWLYQPVIFLTLYSSYYYASINAPVSPIFQHFIIKYLSCRIFVFLQ